MLLVVAPWFNIIRLRCLTDPDHTYGEDFYGDKISGNET